LAGQPRELGHFDLEVATTASGDARDAFLQGVVHNKYGKHRVSVGEDLQPQGRSWRVAGIPFVTATPL